MSLLLTLLFVPQLVYTLFFTQPLNVTRFDVSKSTKYVIYGKEEKIVVLQKFANDYVLLGARNRAYNISLHEMREVDRFEWSTSEGSRENCAAISQSPSACHNYIRTYFSLTPSTFMLCGTHGLQPTCAEFRHGRNDAARIIPAIGMSPVDPDSTPMFVRSNDSIVTVNVADLSSSEPVLIRRNVLKMWKGIENDVILRTPRGQSAFEQATFLSMFDESPRDEILLFFAETPTDTEGFGLHKVPRVGRICADDVGGRGAYSKEWSSYAKARIECRIEESGADTFYFNQLASVSQSSTSYFGAFRSQLAGIGASSICKYDRTTIASTISKAFKSTDSCAKAADSEEMAKMRVNPLLKDKISSHPIFVYHGKDKFVRVVAQEGVRDLRNTRFDILYISTTLGNILKVVVGANGTRHSSTMTIGGDLAPARIMDMWIFAEQLANRMSTESLVVVTEKGILKVPTATCWMATTCATCLSLGDPHCAWADAGECVDLRETSERRREYASQDSGTCDVAIVETGPVPIPPLVSKEKPVCLCDTTTSTPCTTEVIQRDIVQYAGPGIWTHLAAFAFGLVAAVLCNFVLLSSRRWCHGGKTTSKSSSTSTTRPIAATCHAHHQPIDAFTSSAHTTTTTSHENFGSIGRFNSASMHSSIRTYC